MNRADIIGYMAAVLVLVTFWMKTMVPLRVIGWAVSSSISPYAGG